MTGAHGPRRGWVPVPSWGLASPIRHPTPRRRPGPGSSLELSSREKRRREAGTKVRCWGTADALPGFSQSKGPPPCPQLHPRRTPQSPSWDRLWELSGSAGGGFGEDRGELRRRRAPRPAPSRSPLRATAALLAPRPLARSQLPPPRRPPLRLPTSETAPPSPGPSLASAEAAAGRGRVLAPTMRGELWLLVLLLREAARALNPEPGAGRTGRSWPGGLGGRGGVRLAGVVD